MRCPECGFHNDAEAKICIKCGTKLASAEPVRKDMPQKGTPTVAGAPAGQPAWDAPAKRTGSEKPIQKCANCGHYPLIVEAGGGTRCPNCGTTASAGPKEAQQATPSGGKTMSFADVAAESQKGFKLTEISSGTVLSFAGATVRLNRASLDASNQSLSAEVHATIAFEDGSWKISDQSSNQATFIQVKDVTKLPSGTLIALGNRYYRFDAE